MAANPPARLRLKASDVSVYEEAKTRIAWSSEHNPAVGRTVTCDPAPPGHRDKFKKAPEAMLFGSVVASSVADNKTGQEPVVADEAIDNSR